MSKEEEIMNWWLAHRGCTEDAKKRYGSYDWDMIGFAMRQFAKEVAIGFFEWAISEGWSENYDGHDRWIRGRQVLETKQIYQQYLAQK